MNLSTRSKLTRVIDATAAGTTDINGTTIDMVGFRGVMFSVGFGTITQTAVTSIKVQTSSDNSTFNDVLGTAVTVADSDDTSVAWIDIAAPLERYLRVVVDRGTANAVIDFGMAQQYDPVEMPTTHDTTTILGGELQAGERALCGTGPLHRLVLAERPEGIIHPRFLLLPMARQ